MKQSNKLIYFLLLVVTACHASDSVNPLLSDTIHLTSPKPDVSLTLPGGFTATLFADGLGKARHIVVTPNGYVYVKIDGTRNGKGIVRLKDTNGDGVADQEIDFGNFKGIGIGIKNGYLYASSDVDVYRFKLNEDGSVINPDQPERIITGLIARFMHQGKSFAFDNDGNIYVNVGAFSNSCQVADRQAGSPGMNPCPVLDSAASIYIFRADKQNQTYADGIKYVTGLRNVVGIDWNNTTNTLFVMQHGRDQLNMFPQYYDDKQSAELPAECMYELHKGDDAGWPYMYYDQVQGKKMLAPEYGGDGKKTGGEHAIDPVVAFPGHLAPNALLFYTGNQFPEKYKNGAFITFHGSWNRAPEPQAGFYVVFVPFSNGKPSGKWEIFADGFSGGPDKTASGRAIHRPCGLAQGPDGSLYITDDNKGSIWRITYK